MTRWGREPGPSHLFLYCLFVEGPGSEWERVNHMPLVSLSSHPFPFRSVSSGTLGSLTSLMMRESDTVVPLGSLCSPFVTGGRLTQSIESFILG